MSGKYSPVKYHESSFDGHFDDVQMLVPDLEALIHHKVNALPGLDSFEKSVVSPHFTRELSARWKKLLNEEKEYEMEMTNYSNRNAEMLDEVESGKEVTSVRRPSTSNNANSIRRPVRLGSYRAIRLGDGVYQRRARKTT